jgi:hypothetical protein
MILGAASTKSILSPPAPQTNEGFEFIDTQIGHGPVIQTVLGPGLDIIAACRPRRRHGGAGRRLDDENVYYVQAHVLFRNRDDLPHSVVIPDLKQRSSLLDTDQEYEAFFNTPRTFKYFCGIHPMMTGQVTVTAP